MPEIVWLDEEKMYAELVWLGPYFSMVKYTSEGIEYEVLLENDEFNIIEGEDDDGAED